MAEIDFSEHMTFPGTLGTTLDKVIHAIEHIERIPLLVYILLLLLLSFVPRPTDIPMVLVRWSFSLVDLVLLSALPWFGKSFGTQS